MAKAENIFAVWDEFIDAYQNELSEQLIKEAGYLKPTYRLTMDGADQYLYSVDRYIEQLEAAGHKQAARTAQKLNDICDKNFYEFFR